MSPDGVVAQPAERYLLLDRSAATVRSFNVADGVEIGSVRAGAVPDHVVVSPNGRIAFVANRNSNYISVVDLTLNAEVARIRNLRVRQLALNSAGTRLVATLFGLDEVAVIDTADFSILQIVSLDGLGGDVAGTADIFPIAVVVVGNRAYINPARAGRPVFIVDINSFDVSTTVAIPGGSAVNNNIAATPDGSFVIAFRTGVGANRMAIIDANSATNDTTISDTVFPVWAVATTHDPADPDGIFGYAITAGNPNLRIQALDLNLASPTFGQFVAEAFLPFPSPFGGVTVEVALTADSNTAYVVRDLLNASPNLAIVNANTLAVTSRAINAVQLAGVTTALTPTSPPPNAPQVTGVSPSVVVNDNPTTIRVLGANFEVDARARIGTLDPVDANVLSGGELEVTVPSGTAAQGADIIVTNPNSLGPVSDQNLSGILRKGLVVASSPAFQPKEQVLVANVGDGTVAVLNISADATVTPRTPVGHQLLGIAATPDGTRAFASSFSPASAHAFDIVNGVVEASIPYGDPGASGGQGGAIATAVFPPTGDSGAYLVEGVAAGGGAFEERLVVLNAAPPFNRLLTLSSNVMDAQASRGSLAVSPNGRYSYQNSWISGTSFFVDARMIAFDVVTESVNVRSTSSLGVFGLQPLAYVTSDGSWLLLSGPGGFGLSSVLKIFDIAGDPMLTGSAVATINGTPPPGVSGVTLSSPQVCSNRLYAFDSLQNIIYVFRFDPITPDFSQLASFALPFSAGFFSTEMVATPDCSLLYVTLREEDAVAVLDTAAITAGSPGALLTTIETGLGPSTLAIRPGLATPTGSDISVQPISEVTITFDGVTSGGETSVATTNTTSVLAPSGFQVGDPPIFYEISTTATFTGPIEVCFTYEQGQFDGPESKLRVLHEENGVFVDRTLSVDPGQNQICALVDGFSAFVVGLGSVDFLFDSLLDGIADAADQDGVRRSLQAKVIAARLAHQRDQDDVAINQLNALKEEIQAQTGVHLTESEAQLLLNQTDTLIAGF